MGGNSAAQELASRQHGVISTSQLLRTGLTRRQIEIWTRNGHLHRLFQGVYAVGHVGISQEGRWMAAVLCCRGHGQRDAVLSHRSAAELWNLLPRRSGTIDVAVIGENGRARQRGVRIHRPRTLEHSMTNTRSGIPLTSVRRTIHDLDLAKPSRGGATSEQLRQAIRQAGTLGSEDPAQVGDGTRSDLEFLFLKLCRRMSLPPPLVNSRLAGVEVDFCWPASKLVVETDGYRFHRGRQAFEDDHDRDLRLRRAGYEVLRLTYSQVKNNADTIGTTLRSRLRGDFST
jgi:hypothetical protein